MERVRLGSVKELRALTPEEFERAAERLRNSCAGKSYWALIITGSI